MTAIGAMNRRRELIERVSREAGALLRERLHDDHTVGYKGEINLVTEADRLSEALIVGRIAALFPTDDILAEESPERASGSACRWIIDPLDGTTNYAHGYPFFCVSLALEVEGVVHLAAIFDPMLGELFLAERGAGARLNGAPIAISKTGLLSQSLLATGFPYDIRVNRNNNISYFKAMAMRAQAIRRGGSAALDLAYVAAGRFDGFWELRLSPWDTAAGWLLITEAGGRVTDLDGHAYGLQAPHLLASNGLIHQEMVAVLAGTDPLDTP